MMKVLLSLDPRVLRQVDRRAAALRLSRSAYLQALAERDVAQSEGAGSDPDVKEALVRIDQLFAQCGSGDAARAVRTMRDTR